MEDRPLKIGPGFFYGTARKVGLTESCVFDALAAGCRWDRDIREFCSAHGILYLGFSLLTANSRFLAGNVLRPEGRNVPQLVFSEVSGGRAAAGLHPEVAAVVRATGMGIQQLIFRFAQQMGILPVTGTRSSAHMRANLKFGGPDRNEAQLKTIENVAFLE